MKLYLHTIGTSIIMNAAGQQRSQLNNASNENTLSPELEKSVRDIMAEVASGITTPNEGRKNAAEINALSRLCPNGCEAGDLHFLLHTDTRLGFLAAEVLVTIFENCGFSQAQTISISHLNTASKEAFEEGIKWLIHWCEENLPAYQQKGYEIIFSLNGGFKSMLGYMTTIGLFYANKVVYIFEGSDELIEIPRLPVTLHSDEIEKHAAAFLLLASGSVLPIKKVQVLISGIPEIYLEKAGDMVSLSPIGFLLWSRVKKRILTKNLMALPGIAYEQSLHKDFSNLQRDPVRFQEALAKISAIILTEEDPLSCLKRDGGLLYEDYNNLNHQGLPIGHFRIGSETRASCTFSDNTLHLRHWGAHDYVNDNP